MKNAILPYRCPEDHYLSPMQRAAGWKARLRSVSMNVYFGGAGPVEGKYTPDGTKLFKRFADMHRLSPADGWVLMDEHPDWNKEGTFWIWPKLPSEKAAWRHNWPGSLHNGGTTLSFSDGHAGVKKWLVGVTKIPVTYGDANSARQEASQTTDTRDYDWLFSHSTEEIPLGTR
jgi:prepilin-type processing-associated H-X9-DG protein